jgi:hypothetical protein
MYFKFPTLINSFINPIGQANCVLALGFEKMQRGSLTSQYSDRANPMEKHVEIMAEKYDLTGSPVTAQSKIIKKEIKKKKLFIYFLILV